MYKESETLELKKSLSQLKEGIISLSAMLNKTNNANVLFGINDDGKIFGITLGKKTKSDIAHEIQNNLKPLPINVRIEDINENGKKIISVHLEGNDVPYSAYGKYYIRLADMDVLMQPSELQHYFKRKESNYSSWEQKETEYTSDDVNENQLIECIRSANERGRLNYIYRNSKEALMKLGLLTANGKLNNAGWYLFGNNKPLMIKEANFPTDSRTEFGEIKEFQGNIIECIKEATMYIQNHILYKSRIIGMHREDTPEIPSSAIREIVINSFAHCSYAESSDFNSYTIFKSSVKIYNPGPIYHDIDPKKFASGLVGSKIRNILISQVLFNYGYIDAFGTGFDRTFSLCASENIKYKYNNDEYGFTFIFERKTEFLNEINNNNITDLDKKIIETLKENKYATLPELSIIINKSESTIYRHLNHLTQLCLIKRIGSRKEGYWNVIG